MDILRKIYAKLTTSEGGKVVAQNFFSLASSQLVTFIIPLIVTPYLIRVLGVNQFGLIAFAQALIQYFVVLIDYGFNLSAIREISIHREDSSRISTIFSTVAVIRGFFLAISLIVLCLGMIYIPKLRNDWPIYAAYLLFLFGYVLFPTHFFQGIEKMKYLLICNSVSFFSSLALFFFVKSEKDILCVPLLAALGAIVSGILGWKIAHKQFGTRFSFPEFHQIRYQLKEGWEAFLINISTVTFSSARIFALGLFSDYTITGYYAIADRMAGLLNAAPLGLIYQAVYPRLSMSFSQDPERAKRQAGKLQKMVTWSYLVIAVVLFFYARPLVFLFSNSTAEETILSFRLLLIAVLLIAANAFRLQLCFVSRRKDVFIKIIILGFIGTVLTLALSAWLSYQGTACSLILIAIAAIFVTPEIQHQKNAPLTAPNA